MYAVIARILFSAWWNLLWWIKTNLVWRWQMQWLQEYDFLYVGTLCDAWKQIFFRSIVCNYCKNTVFHIFGPSLMNQIKFSLDVANAGYHFLHVGIFCDESKLIYFGGDKCSDCKNTIFCMLEHCVMHQTNFLLK